MLEHICVSTHVSKFDENMSNTIQLQTRDPLSLIPQRNQTTRDPLKPLEVQSMSKVFLMC